MEENKIPTLYASRQIKRKLKLLKRKNLTFARAPLIRTRRAIDFIILMFGWYSCFVFSRNKIEQDIFHCILRIVSNQFPYRDPSAEA